MEEEAKQSINEERIDNPDGSYTVKTVFKREHTGGFSSYIENFSAEGKYLNGEYYNDENFSDIVVKQKIVYQYGKIFNRNSRIKKGYNTNFTNV